MEGASGPGYEYGRLEVFLRGLWTTICDEPASFTPDSASVACGILGFDGGAALEFRRPYNNRFEPDNQVLFDMMFSSDRPCTCPQLQLPCMCVRCQWTAVSAVMHAARAAGFAIITVLFNHCYPSEEHLHTSFCVLASPWCLRGHTSGILAKSTALAVAGCACCSTLVCVRPGCGADTPVLSQPECATCGM